MIVILKPGVSLQAMGELVKFIESQGLRVGRIVRGEQRTVIRNLSEAMEQSHSALLIVDPHHRIEYANRGLCRQLGYSRRELFGRDWREFRAPESPPEALAELVAVLRAGRAWEGEWINRRKDGTTYPVRGIVTPVKQRDGRLSCYVSVFDDVTESKRREAELQQPVCYSRRAAFVAGIRACATPFLAPATVDEPNILWQT